MKNYTDIDDFADGVAKVAKFYHKHMPKETVQMPVLLQVDGMIAPFGMMTVQEVNGVSCCVFSGMAKTMENISVESREEQIRMVQEAAKGKSK